MRHFTVVIVIAASLLQTTSILAAGVAQAQGTGSLSGTSTSSNGAPIADATVQLRNLTTGRLVGSTTSSATGAFSFVGLPAGNFAVEVVNAAGEIIGTSASITVAAGATVTGVAVTASAAGAGAAGVGAATGVSTAVVVTTVAAAAGVAAAVAIGTNASPSR